jgi:hypothetical protein
MLRVANSTPIVDLDSRLNSFLVNRESTTCQHLVRVEGLSWLTISVEEKERVMVSKALADEDSHVRLSDSRITNQHNLHPSALTIGT